MTLPPQHAVRAEICRRSFYQFLIEFWDVIVKEDLIDNWHIEYLCDELQEIVETVRDREPSEGDTIINVPPGTTKSTITTIMLPVWAWTIDPTLRIITGSYTLELAIEHSVKSRDIIRSDRFHSYYPTILIKSDADNKSKYENTETGSRTATSVGGTITGKHAHLIIIDDPINPEQAESDVARIVANRWTGRTLSMRKVDQKVTPTILIMQRLHQDDPTGHKLSKETDINHICLPGEASKDIHPPELVKYYKDGLLDPVRLDRVTLRSLKEERMGSYGYAGQVMQSPVPDGGGMLKRQWFTIITRGEFEAKMAKPIMKFYLDTAYTKDNMNDPTAIMACTKIKGNLYIENVSTKHLEFPELIKYLIEYCGLHGYTGASQVKVEPAASGLSIIQQLKQETKLNVIRAIAPKDSKEVRVSAVAPAIEAGRVFIVEGNWNESFLAECEMFPHGKHDDQVDCLSMAVGEFNKKHQGYLT